MQSFKFVKELSKFEHVINERIPDFLKMIDDINSLANKTNTFIVKIVSSVNPGDAHMLANQLQALYPESLTNIVMKPKLVYKSLDAINDVFKEFVYEYGDKTSISKAVSIIDSTEEAFDNYFHRKSREDCIQLVLSVSELKVSLDNILNLVRFSTLNLYDEANSDQSNTFTIYLRGELELSQFGKKIYAINDIFKFCIYMLNIDSADAIININKIESGSLFTKLTTDPKVVSLASCLIASAATYAYNNYTTEGKIVSFPEKVESIDKVLDLRNRLSEAGINVVEMDEEIKKSSIKLARAINSLIQDQYEIEINNKKYSADSEDSKKLLENKAPKLLTKD